MPIYNCCPCLFSLAQLTVTLMDCLSFCVGILHEAISRITAGSEWIIDNLCDSLTVSLPSFSSTCQIFMLICFLLLINRVLSSWKIFTITLPAGQQDEQMHSVVSPQLVLGPSMNGIDTIVTDNLIKISNVNLCSFSGNQQEVAQSSFDVTPVTTNEVVGKVGSTLGLASSSHTTKVEQSVSQCQPDGNYPVHYNLSDMNLLGKLPFAAVITSAPYLVGKFVELESEANEVIRHMHMNRPHFQNMLKTMLREAFCLIVCSRKL